LNYGSSPPITTVTTSGTYILDAYELASWGPKALKILATDSTTGAKTWYYVEARKAIGFDSFLTTDAELRRDRLDDPRRSTRLRRHGGNGKAARSST
jgi:hypothetical protein